MTKKPNAHFGSSFEAFLHEEGIADEVNASARLVPNAKTIEADADMTQHKIISHTGLRDEMMAIARGEHPAPADAGRQSFESVEALRGCSPRKIAQKP